VKALTKFLVLLVPLGGWMLVVRHDFNKLRPSGLTLTHHLATMPEPEGFRVISLNGRDYLAVQGPLRALLTFPSGPPVYVFDESGGLVDWFSDVGDDRSFNNRWPGVSTGRSVTRQEAMRWAGGAASCWWLRRSPAPGRPSRSRHALPEPASGVVVQALTSCTDSRPGSGHYFVQATRALSPTYYPGKEEV
jgi:hypothetical protein